MPAPLNTLISRTFGICAALALTGCELLPSVEPTLTPQPRPASLNVQKPPTLATPSEQSQSLARFYRTVLNDGLTRGLLRTDGGGPDTPYTADMLARNFENIAFFDEYAGSPNSAQGGAAPLRRWAAPVRFETYFGASATQANRTRDANAVRAYAARLARVTNHPITVSTSGNFKVLFVGQDDRDETLRHLQAMRPQLATRTIESLLNISRSTYCLVVAFEDQNNPATYDRAIAIIRTEQPDLMRLACIHEELAQGLGLANDSPAARPSIFNDDDEFALLTTHDEALLSMLYDPRLTPGLTADAARPIVRKLAAEATGEDI